MLRLGRPSQGRLFCARGAEYKVFAPLSMFNHDKRHIFYYIVEGHKLKKTDKLITLLNTHEGDKKY